MSMADAVGMLGLMRKLGAKCTACGHTAALHAPIGRDPQPGAKCATCQCPGLELPEHAGVAMTSTALHPGETP
jgi:hypothetical protein